MKLKHLVLYLFLIISGSAHAQYLFKGKIDKDQWQSDVYLSYVEDFRKINGIYADQIIGRAKVDSLGNFNFSGSQLSQDNRIYRIHVDNCNNGEIGNHFNGHCEDSRDILFIAKNTDTIQFPLGFADQIFCEINSTNPKTNALIKIDSLKNLMQFDYTDYYSETNTQLNNKKWLARLKEFSNELNEPLASLYIFNFLSNRENILYEDYLADIENSSFYSDLSKALENSYPNSNYTEQFNDEFKTDEFKINRTTQSESNFPKWILLILGISLILNIFLVVRFLLRRLNRKQTALNLLTKQETKIFKQMLEDKSNKEIAELNFVSVSTVKSHINNIYKKLNVQSRDEAKSLYLK